MRFISWFDIVLSPLWLAFLRKFAAISRHGIRWRMGISRSLLSCVVFGEFQSQLTCRVDSEQNPVSMLVSHGFSVLAARDITMVNLRSQSKRRIKGWPTIVYCRILLSRSHFVISDHCNFAAVLSKIASRKGLLGLYYLCGNCTTIKYMSKLNKCFKDTQM